MGKAARTILVTSALALASCGPSVVRSEYHRRTTLTKAMVPVPQPPFLDGPMPEPTKLATEARLVYGAYPGSPTRFSDSGSATWVPSWHFSGRLSYGLATWLEAGLGIGASANLGGRPLMRGVDDQGLEGLATQAVFGLRIMAPLYESVKLGLVLEGGALFLPTWREAIDETSVRYDDSYAPWFQDYDTTSSSARSIQARYGLIRTGPQISWTSPRGLYLGVGAILVSHPHISAVQEQEWSCSWTEDEPIGYDCPGPSEPSRAYQTVIFMPTAAVSAPLGPLRLQAQLHLGSGTGSMGASLALRTDLQAE